MKKKKKNMKKTTNYTHYTTTVTHMQLVNRDVTLDFLVQPFRHSTEGTVYNAQQSTK